MAHMSFVGIILDDAVQLGMRTIPFDEIRTVELAVVRLSYLKFLQRCVGVLAFLGAGFIFHWGFGAFGIAAAYFSVLKPARNKMVTEHRVVFRLSKGEEVEYRCGTFDDSEAMAAKVQGKIQEHRIRQETAATRA